MNVSVINSKLLLHRVCFLKGGHNQLAEQRKGRTVRERNQKDNGVTLVFPCEEHLVIHLIHRQSFTTQK